MPPSSPMSGTVRFSERDKRVIFSGLMLGMLLAPLDQTIVATALPAMARDLKSVDHLSWIVSIYLLTSTAVTPIYGKLSDLYGRKRMLQVAVGLFVAASLLCALAANMTQLIFFRALQGFGGGGLMAMAHATIADVVAPRERGRYQGYFSGVFATASVAGPALGGFFAEHLTWRWVFWINLPIGIAAIVICNAALRRLPIRGVRHRIDYLGAVLLMAAIGELLLVTTWGGMDYAWDSSVILGLGASAAILLAGFALQEMHARAPVLPLRLFRDPVFAVASLVTVLAGMSMFAGIIYLPVYLQIVTGASASEAGVLVIPLMVGMSAGAFATGRTVSQFGRYKPFPLVGLAVSAVVYTVLSRTGADTPQALLIALMVLLGLATGMVNPTMMVAVQNAAPSADLGTATSSISFFRSMGGSFGVALVGAVLLHGLKADTLPGAGAFGHVSAIDLLRGNAVDLARLPSAERLALVHDFTDAFSHAFLTATAVAVIAWLVTWLLRELPLRSEREAPSAPDQADPARLQAAAGAAD
ncbi:MAG TPA: MDR family MFS transporter [Candidatus Sulfotelmatobacter sp.]|nr:MDR family MFS transporter [Candidatus Sulfotelmatobacter sp.]